MGSSNARVRGVDERLKLEETADTVYNFSVVLQTLWILVWILDSRGDVGDLNTSLPPLFHYSVTKAFFGCWVSIFLLLKCYMLAYY